MVLIVKPQKIFFLLLSESFRDILKKLIHNCNICVVFVNNKCLKMLLRVKLRSVKFGVANAWCMEAVMEIILHHINSLIIFALFMITCWNCLPNNTRGSHALPVTNNPSIPSFRGFTGLQPIHVHHLTYIVSFITDGVVIPMYILLPLFPDVCIYES